MSDNTYNGWTNRATWLVNVWFNPENRADVDAAKEAIEKATDAMPDYMRDFLCTNEIMWWELKEQFEEEGSDE